MTGEIAEFGYSRSSRNWAYANAVSDLVFATAFMAIATYGISDVDGAILVFGAIAMYYVALIFFVRFFWRIKYRHVLHVSYIVSGAGIRIRADESDELISWDSISIAEKVPMLPAYRLRASTEAKPIVLFIMSSWLPASQENRRNEIAENILRAGLRNRLQTRWLPSQ